MNLEDMQALADKVIAEGKVKSIHTFRNGSFSVTTEYNVIFDNDIYTIKKVDGEVWEIKIRM